MLRNIHRFAYVALLCAAISLPALAGEIKKDPKKDVPSVAPAPTPTSDAVTTTNSKPTLDQVLKAAEDYQSKLGPKGTAASPATGEQIKWQVVSSGGGVSNSTSYMVVSVVGQLATGNASSASYAVHHGFLQDFGAGSGGCCVGLTGNVDGDSGDMVDIGDLTALIGYLFIPPYTAPDCMDEANVDGTGSVDIGDLTALIGYLFIPPYTPPAPC